MCEKKRPYGPGAIFLLYIFMIRE